MVELEIVRHYDDTPLPFRKHDSDVGYDLTAMRCKLNQHDSFVYMFDTGISVKPPKGYYVEIVPRSSIIKTGFILANSVGIIDPDYTGSIICALRFVGIGTGQEEAQYLMFQRIAQMIVRKHEHVKLVEKTSLTDTVRGSGGFGSTG